MKVSQVYRLMGQVLRKHGDIDAALLFRKEDDTPELTSKFAVELMHSMDDVSVVFSPLGSLAHHGKSSPFPVPKLRLV